MRIEILIGYLSGSCQNMPPFQNCNESSQNNKQEHCCSLQELSFEGNIYA